MASPFMEVLEKMLDENEDDMIMIIVTKNKTWMRTNQVMQGNVLMAVIKTTETSCNQTLIFQMMMISLIKMEVMMRIEPVKVRTCSLGLMKTEFVLNCTSF